MRTLRILSLALSIAASSCGAAQTPTSATATEPATILFSGTLQPRATRFYSYTLTSAGSVTALLASLELNGVPMRHALELGLGIPAGTGCSVQQAANTTTSLVPQLRQESPAGTYCVRIADADGLPATMTFTIRVMHP